MRLWQSTFLVHCLVMIGVVTRLAAEVNPPAPGDRDSIAAEVKTDQDAIKSVTEEIARDDKEVADAEALAANPPADVKPEDKTAYIDQEKNEAQASQDAASDARQRLGELQKSLDDALARLKAATTRPTTGQTPNV